MALELIVNLLLLGTALFCYWYVGATMPSSAINELGAEQWPQALLMVLIPAICWNIFKYFKKNKKEEIAAAFTDFIPSVGRLVKSKLFVGMVLVVVMALMYEPVGFMLTCLLFLIAYGYLLGQRKWPMLIGTSLVITIVLYIGFAVFLGVLLPRGQVSFLRNLALLIESLIPRL
ncbi:tripartite tricarboxylate transporter TctB family protein [Lacrimispora sp.]|uniref:tripartite tricarboxylate transporter TctB family protein n=1 Tax=Lacrimispora sp. TaxID=2719234 RepID=UPI002FDA3E3A